MALDTAYSTEATNHKGKAAVDIADKETEAL